jgi:hypothetical protein
MGKPNDAWVTVLSWLVPFESKTKKVVQQSLGKQEIKLSKISFKYEQIATFCG